MLVLRKLSDWPLALAAAGLLTFSPFYLSEGRVLHVDALVSSLMLLSGLLLLLSLESKQRRYLVLSGPIGGFALLTKTVSLFLVPFTGLALLAYLIKRLQAGWVEHAGKRVRWAVSEIWRGLVEPGLLWLVLAALPFALWPAMWVEPLETVQNVFLPITGHVQEGHPNRFFAGRIYDEVRPPISFYPVAMAFKSSFLTLTLTLAALGQYTLWPRRGKLPLHPITFWLLVAYVIFFTAQMTIGSHQDFRYILPASAMLEVLAAVGLVGTAELVRRGTTKRENRLVRMLPLGMVGLVLGLQALIALPYAPDYGAHHNQLLGGNRVAVSMVEIESQNEGITYVAEYLSGQPDPVSLRVGTRGSIKKSLQQYFGGEVFRRWTAEDDYNLISVKDAQRDPESWEEKTSTYEDSPPQLVVYLDGVEYMRLYASEPPTRPIVIRRGGGVGFVVLAWVWTATLAATLVWSHRHAGRQTRGLPVTR
jgi:hypothetical protein